MLEAAEKLTQQVCLAFECPPRQIQTPGPLSRQMEIEDQNHVRLTEDPKTKDPHLVSFIRDPCFSERSLFFD